MKEVFINNSLRIIKNYYPEYSNQKIEKIKYGLLGLYLLITKSVIIFALALYMNIFKELLIFTIIYNILRSTSFGMHASKSWICLVSSTTIFILSTYISKKVIIPINFKIIFGIIGIILIYKNSPADTKKRPIINKKRRQIYKRISTIISIIFVIISIIINNSFLSNAFILSLIIQCVFTSKTTYKICGETYDNYKNYQIENGLN